MIIFQNETLVLEWFEKTSILQSNWVDTTADKETFVKNLDIILNYIKTTSANNWLSILECFRTLPPNFEEYLMINFASRVFHQGVKRIGVVISVHLLSILTDSSLLIKNFERPDSGFLKIFIRAQEGRYWLENQEMFERITQSIDQHKNKKN